MNESPVLLITFNRPKQTRKVLEKIKEAKVKNLYVANDAPRIGIEEDEMARHEIIELLKMIDWDCKLHTLFQDTNLGCGLGPATAISWAFENEESLIILEDDCVPSVSFFKYCNYCLDKYKSDNRIWLVSGRSHQQGSKFFKDIDYIFTHYGHSWGWATWKRCWEHFDINMSDAEEFLKNGGALNVLCSKEEGNFFNNRYKRLIKDKNLQTHVWDIQFGYTLLKNQGLCIVPAKNLIQNIGYEGVHNKTLTKFHLLKAYDDYSITKEPKEVKPNPEYEKLHFKTHIKKIFGPKPIHIRLIRKSAKILNIK